MVQRVEQVYVWRYWCWRLMGELRWRWVERWPGEVLAVVVSQWREAGGPAHRLRAVREVGVPLVVLLAYTLKLNPVERVSLGGASLGRGCGVCGVGY